MSAEKKKSSELFAVVDSSYFGYWILSQIREEFGVTYSRPMASKMDLRIVFNYYIYWKNYLI